MLKTILMIVLIAICAASICAQTTAFTYQGSLKDGASSATGNYDFQFALYDAVSGGNQVGSTLNRNTVAVANGIFTVSLDFGSQFPGANRYLEIRVRLTGQPSFTTLTPRQLVTSDPYSVKSLTTDTASSLNCAACVTAAQIASVNGASIVGTIPAASIPSGSSNYIQNGTSPQSSSNFNVSGTGTANFLNATTQFNLNNTRILSAPASNLFVGPQTGQSNTTGNSNSFFGSSAGTNNTSGGNNSFFGYLAGNTTNTGSGNAFFGYQAGRSNTTGGVNSYFGFNAGEFSTTANYNSFFGFNAGNKTTAEDNSFFGAAAGQNTTTGNQNSFFGRQAGSTNTTGFQNSFFGRNAGLSNTTGDNNSFFGTSAGEFTTSGVQNSFFGGFAGEFNTTGSANSFFGFVAGYQNTTGDRNSVFGFDAGRLNQTGIDNSSFGYSAGRNTTGSNNAFFGSAAGTLNAAGNSNAFFGRNTGSSNTSGNENSFFGAAAGAFNTTGVRNTAIGFNANPVSGNLQYATAIGADSTVSTSNTIALGRSNGSDQVVIPGNLAISGSFNPSSMNVSGNAFVGGNFGVGTTSPQSKLAVQTATNNYGFLHTDGAVSFGSFVGGTSAPTGGWLGTATNHPLHFFTNNGAARMSIDQTGDVGVGTTAPPTRFAVRGGPGWTSNGWAGSLSFGNASALGWEANASGQRFGIGQSTGGLYFFRTNSAFGSTASPANYDMSITDSGNVSQARDKSGLVKAMVLVDPFLPASQYVVRCYNFQNDSSTAPCGIAVTRNNIGDYRLDVGFTTSDRFVSATLARTNATDSSITVNPTGTSVFVYIAASDGPKDQRFFLIIY